MGVGRFFILVLALSVSSETESSHSKRLDQAKRFLITDLVDKFVDQKYKREECILCKCYQECHVGQFLVSDADLCKPYVDQINCNDVNRCTCCNDLFLFNACENGGKCHNRGHGNFTCDCPPGHYGQRCESSGSTGTHTNTNYCTTNPCKNGAICTNGVNSYTCRCQPGWTGTNCEIDIDECVTSNPCKNGGVCTNTQGKYACTCTGGWTGTNCDADVDECLRQPCQDGSTCQNNAGSYSCSCASGFTGTTCGTDIDECSLYRFCQNGATCTNIPGSFTCTCATGWTGKQCHTAITDIDECSSYQPCRNGAKCINTQGGYTCRCKPGWTGDQCDLDACHIKQCGTNGVCQHQETFPFYKCNCTNGHFGHHCELAPMLPKWTDWFYGACSVSCGNGTVARIRKCSTGHDEDCAGVAMETTTCSEKPC